MLLVSARINASSSLESAMNLDVIDDIEST
jgi:hypothetical protein